MRVIPILFILIILAGCSNNKKKLSGAKNDTVLLYPYAPIYSELDPGDPYDSKAVLEIWRAFETGNILTVKSKFSDSLTLIFPDKILNGKRDNILDLFQKRRSRYTDVQCYVDSWQPAHARQTNEDLVLIWGRQDCTDRNGRRDYLVLHETWWFDPSGKIRKMIQYNTHPH